MTQHALSCRKQRGIVTLWAVILIIVGVTVAMIKVYDVAGTRSTTNVLQSESTTALFLAESGLRIATGTLKNQAESPGTFSNTNCSSLAGAAVSLPTGTTPPGTYQVTSATAVPTTCSGSACTGCTLEVRGTQGNAQRTLTGALKLEASNKGRSGCGSNITLTVKNAAATPAIAVFNLAWRRSMNNNDWPQGCEVQTGGGQITATSYSCTGCQVHWDIVSQSGANAVGSMSTTVPIGSGNLNLPVTQTISRNANYAEVAALVPGISGLPTNTSTSMATPPVVGAYWSEDNQSPQTVNVSNGSPTVGETTNGVFQSSGTSAAYTSDEQNTLNWCWGGDTLVYLASGRSDTLADTFTGIWFNTIGGNTTGSQAVQLTNVTHFPPNPNTGGATAGDVFGEVWYAYNPNFLTLTPAADLANTANPQPSPLAYYVSSYKGKGTGTIAGVSLTLNLTDCSNNVCSFEVGDEIFTGTTPAYSGTTIQSVTPAITGPGTYTVTLNTAPGTSCTNCTVRAAPSGFNAGTSPNRLYLPRAITLPAGELQRFPIDTSALGVTGTRIAVRSGAGTLQGNTLASQYQYSNVTDPTYFFAIDKRPTTALEDATLCGGTCAFFNAPNSNTSLTEFTVLRSGGTSQQWASGFVCLRGVNKNLISAVTDISNIYQTFWREKITP